MKNDSTTLTAMEPQALSRHVFTEKYAAAGETTHLDVQQRVARALADCPGVTAVLPSDANFLAVRMHNAEARYQQLLRAGVVVRKLTRYPGLADALRLSIGTVAENDAALAVLAQPLEAP